MKGTMIVVGDKFKEFAANESVICISDLERVIENNDPEYANTFFELGQGVSAARVERLIQLANSHRRRDFLLFEPLVKCGLKHVHKIRPENSMLSIPMKIAEDRYEADMLLDDDSELMADHVSGQHLQGMVLIEAARQMILAVTEEYLISDFGGPCAFIWNGIDVAYFDYAFPTSTRLIYQIKEIDRSRKKRLRFIATIDLIQRSAKVCSATSKVEVFERQLVERREQKVASAAIAAIKEKAVA